MPTGPWLQTVAGAMRPFLDRHGLGVLAQSKLDKWDRGKAMAEWSTLLGLGWTLVEHFEHDGRRYVLAIDNRPRCPGIELLSKRERDVAARALAGQHDKAIAYDLGISASTVRVLVRRAAMKVGVSSRRELLGKLAALRERVANPELHEPLGR